MKVRRSRTKNSRKKISNRATLALWAEALKGRHLLPWVAAGQRPAYSLGEKFFIEWLVASKLNFLTMQIMCHT